MRVFAYCARRFHDATRRAAGISPHTCPPCSADTWWTVASFVNGADFVYLDLHGQPDATAWYGDQQIVAVTAGQIGAAQLAGATVFAVNCHLADSGSPMARALFAAGAAHVIAGEGPNYGPPSGRLYGAPLLGLWLRRFLRIGFEVPRALSAAKRITAFRGGGSYVVEDVMAFRAIDGARV